MASNLRVDQITSSTTGSVSIGTATFTGGLSGDITGLNVTGVITATTLNQNVSGVVTATSFNATSNITVGDSFINATSIGIGTTTTAGRNAGVGTAAGTLIYNTTTDQLEVYTPDGWQVGAKSPFIVSSPTVTADTSSRPGWAVFSFTSPGSLVVASGNATAEYLVIAGGGGGGNSAGGGGGGGGGGGYLSGSIPLSVGTYTIQVGGGGAGGVADPYPAPSVLQQGKNGTNSFITNPGISSITSFGGGGGAPGGNTPNTSYPANPGGSGGGGGYSFPTTGQPGGFGLNPSTPAPELAPFGLSFPYGFTQGYNGGNGEGPYPGAGGGGGGGAGGVGETGGTSTRGGDGGVGETSAITGSSVTRAGGGGGAGWPSGQEGIGADGGGNGGTSSPPNGSPGTSNTGGGGGGKYGGDPGFSGGNGGSGIVIIAYPTA